MKTTVVPAQITTVEDKIAGNLNFTQLLLIIAPIFLGGAIYAFFPPITKFTVIKTIIVVILAVVSMTLAIRIKGKLILEWIVIKSRYNKRPQFYIFNKNDSHLRNITDQTENESEKITAVEKVHENSKIPAIPKLVRIEHMLTDPKADFHFKTNKQGGLNVHIKEIK